MSKTDEKWKADHGELYVKIDYILLSQYFKQIRYYVGRVEFMLDQAGIDHKEIKNETAILEGQSINDQDTDLC